MNKICTQCSTEKTLDNFSKDKRQRLGRRPECKTCEHKKPYYLLKSLNFRLARSKWHKHLYSTITIQDIVNMGRICNFCYLHIEEGASIHRLDHSKDYTPDNCVIVHKKCHAIYGEHNKRPRKKD